MLVITRKIGEAFAIGDEIVIAVTDVNGAQVRIGVDAPRHIAVLRQELTELPAKASSNGSPEFEFAADSK